MKEKRKIKLSLSVKVIAAIILVEFLIMLILSRIPFFENASPVIVAAVDGLFLGSIIVFIIKHAFYPLRNMIRVMEEIGQGKITSRLNVSSSDEMGLISKQINNMADGLQSYYNQVKKSESFLRAITDGVDYEIMLIDKDYKILWANKKVMRLTNEDKKNVIGNYCYRVTHGLKYPCTAPKDICPIREVLKNKKSVTVLHDHFHGGTNPLNFEITLYPLFNEAGEVERFIHIGKDVTEKTRMVEELKKAKQRLERYSATLEELVEKRTKNLKEANEELKLKEAQLIQSEKMAAVGQLASGVAHEINNPLAVIMNNAELIQRRIEKDMVDIEEVKIMIKSIKAAVIRSKKITQSLLDFSHVSLEEFKPVSINDVINKVLSLIEHEMSLGNMNIKRIIQSDLPKIKGDFQSLQQVFFNLIINAKWAIQQRFGREGGDITIESQYRPGDDFIFVTVSDTGSGIPKDNLSRIFEAFFTTKSVGAGTGLGLSIVYNIIKKHKGEISVDSEIDKGTIFKIVFPVEK
ncbi:MAG: ATP-binding protein [Candidatus Omnitrophota bacterium]|nr:PAS domain-containing protein [Candidatus Omnitrophota bacterium]